MAELLKDLPIDQEQLPVVVAAIAGALALLIFLKLIGSRSKRRKQASASSDELTINIAKLPTTGPPATGPQVELYNTPMRLAVLVIAPAGRSGVLPEIGQTTQMIESIAPGLKQACDVHLPIIRRWPAQLSSRGFANAFCARAELPGDGGKGSPWSALAGSFQHQGRRYMAGIIFRADRPNGIGQLFVPRDEAWPDFLRIKT